MNAPRKIFVDADAFIALARKDGANHERAVSSLRQLIKQPTVFITSNYVFAESVTVISMHMGHAAAVRFIEAMQSDESIYLLQRTTDAIDEAAMSTAPIWRFSSSFTWMPFLVLTGYIRRMDLCSLKIF